MQKATTGDKNSTEAELVALVDNIIKGESVEEFFMDQGSLLDDDFVTNVHLVYQDIQSTIALIKTNTNNQQRSKYFKVRQEYVKEHLATSKLEIEHMKTGKMLANILTKPIRGEHFHTIAHAVLGNHRYVCFSNRGAKSDMSEATVESITTALVGAFCSNHAASTKKYKISK